MAVMGILLLNIVTFALPRYAYVDPTFYGRAAGADWWAWAITFVLAEGKMRGLFTMLFGASTVLIAERTLATGGSPARRHYARMISLLAIGMVHAYLIWSGDILVLYALCGALVFVAWRWDPPRLVAVAAILLAAQLVTGALDYAAARTFEERATAPSAPAPLRDQWERYLTGWAALRTEGAAEIAAFRGGWAQVLPMRVSITAEAQRTTLPATMPEAIALMLLGMALYRSGFFSGAWSRHAYRIVLIAGYGLGLPAYGALIWWLERRGYDPITLLISEPVHLVLLRPGLALAHATLVIALVRSGALKGFSRRLAAVGRVALSNYVGASLICTYIFCGYGLGWFGHLQRWQLYPLVLALWALMLWWSPLWLARFAHGPVEWLWRWSAAWLGSRPFSRNNRAGDRSCE